MPVYHTVTRGYLQYGGGTLVLQGALWRDTVYDIAPNRYLTIRSGARLSGRRHTLAWLWHALAR